VLFYDDPVFLEEVLDNRAQLMIEVTDRVLQDTDIDYFAFWEDMAYKTGPLLSPALFKKYLSPRYKRVTEFLRSRGIDLIFVDSDGNVEELIPLWLDAGVNGVWPFEVTAGMDVVRLRKQYGNDLLMIGGLDKRALAQGRDAITREIESKVPWMIERGGYIPQVDHGVPPDVSWDNFCYFNELLRKTLGIE
jgi:uroporphyrinogen-III decarboxylase